MKAIFILGILVLLVIAIIKKNRPHAAPAGAAHGSGRWETIGMWLGIVLIFTGAITWLMKWGSHLEESKPERREFSAYYQFWIEYPDGTVKQGEPIFAKITPNTIGASYVDVTDRGDVNFRWTRGGDGAWTKFKAQHTAGSYLRITNVSSNADADFAEWHTKILATIGDDEDPRKKGKITLLRL